VLVTQVHDHCRWVSGIVPLVWGHVCFAKLHCFSLYHVYSSSRLVIWLLNIRILLIHSVISPIFITLFRSFLSIKRAATSRFFYRYTCTWGLQATLVDILVILILVECPTVLWASCRSLVLIIFESTNCSCLGRC
jgi:hypothetical protein